MGSQCRMSGIEYNMWLYSHNSPTLRILFGSKRVTASGRFIVIVLLPGNVPSRSMSASVTLSSLNVSSKLWKSITCQRHQQQLRTKYFACKWPSVTFDYFICKNAGCFGFLKDLSVQLAYTMLWKNYSLVKINILFWEYNNVRTSDSRRQ